VEGFWSPALVASSRNCRRKPRRIFSNVFSCVEDAEDLSLSGGASSSIRASQAGHHLSAVSNGFLKRRRRPSWVALASSFYAARQLARTPLGEG
jgi:hypothetical protein